MMAFSISVLACSKGENQASKANEPAPSVTDSVEIRTEKMQRLASTIRKCSRLYATEYHIHKIITHDDELKLKGSVLGFDYDFKLPVGSRSIAIPMDAVVKCFVDFGQFDTGQVDYNDNKLTITFNYSGDNSTVTLKDLDNKGPDGFGQCLSCSTLASTSEPVRWFKNVFAITRKIREA